MSKVTFQLSLSPDTARYTGSQTTRQESKTYCASNGRIQLPNRMIFGKLYCKFFIMDMVAFMQGGIGQIVSVNINPIVEKHTLKLLFFLSIILGVYIYEMYSFPGQWFCSTSNWGPDESLLQTPRPRISIGLKIPRSKVNVI